MNKFAYGSEVLCIKGLGDELTEGKTYVVGSSGYYDDNHVFIHRNDKGDYLAYKECRFELSTKQPGISPLEKDGPSMNSLSDLYHELDRLQAVSDQANKSDKSITIMAASLSRLIYCLRQSTTGFKELRDTIEFGLFFGIQATNAVIKADEVLDNIRTVFLKE